jgi:hypothetical protein
MKIISNFYIYYIIKMNSIQSLVKIVEELQQKVNKLESENGEIKAKLKSVHEIADTRADNFPPSYYRKKGIGVYREFKQRWVIDIKENISGYIILETIVGWHSHDHGGTKIVQKAYGMRNTDYYAIRYGSAFDNCWSEWNIITNKPLVYPTQKVKQEYNIIYDILNILCQIPKQNKYYKPIDIQYILTNFYKLKYFTDTGDYNIENIKDICLYNIYTKKEIKSTFTKLVEIIFNALEYYRKPIQTKEEIIESWLEVLLDDKIIEMNKTNNYNQEYINNKMEKITSIINTNLETYNTWWNNMIIYKFISNKYPDSVMC